MRYEIVLMMEEDYSGKMARIFLGNLVKFIYSEKATKFFRNLHRRFDRYYIGQIYSGDLAFSEYININS